MWWYEPVVPPLAMKKILQRVYFFLQQIMNAHFLIPSTTLKLQRPYDHGSEAALDRIKMIVIGDSRKTLSAS